MQGSLIDPFSKLGDKAKTFLGLKRTRQISSDESWEPFQEAFSSLQRREGAKQEKLSSAS